MCGRVRRSPPDFLGGASRKAKPACAKASAGEGGDRGTITYVISDEFSLVQSPRQVILNGVFINRGKKS